MQIVILVLVGLFLVTSPQTASAAGRVFYDGFESGNTNQWNDYGAPPNNQDRCVVVTTATDRVLGPYAGTRMVRCNADGTKSFPDNSEYETLVAPVQNYTNEIFYRVWHRPDANVDNTVGSTWKMFQIRYWDGTQSTYRDLFDAVSSTAPGSACHGFGNAGSYVMNSYWGGAPGDNSCDRTKWSKTEYYINQATSVVKVWHNDALIRNETIPNMSGKKWNDTLRIVGNWATSHDAVNHLYFDEVEIYTDLGTGASGSMANGDITQGGGGTSTTAPVAPMNLRVQ